MYKNKISKSFIKTAIRYSWFNLFIFIPGIFISFLFYKTHPHYTTIGIKDLAVQFNIYNNNIVYNIIQIFLSNSLVCITAILTGLIPCIFFPIVINIINASSMGMVLAYYNIKNYSVFNIIISGILPHGILEISAIFFSISIGFILCKKTTYKIFCKKDFNKKEYIKNIVFSFFFIILPLLFLASLIEVLITPLITKL